MQCWRRRVNRNLLLVFLKSENAVGANEHFFFKKTFLCSFYLELTDLLLFGKCENYVVPQEGNIVQKVHSNPCLLLLLEFHQRLLLQRIDDNSMDVTIVTKDIKNHLWLDQWTEETFQFDNLAKLHLTQKLLPVILFLLSLILMRWWNVKCCRIILLLLLWRLEKDLLLLLGLRWELLLVVRVLTRVLLLLLGLGLSWHVLELRLLGWIWLLLRLVLHSWKLLSLLPLIKFP